MVQTADQKIEECRAEVDGAMNDLHRRIESVEVMQQLIHDIYNATKHTDERLTNLMLSFSSFDAAQQRLHEALPPDNLRIVSAMVAKFKRRAEFYEKLSEKLTESGIKGVIVFLLGLMALGFLHWFQSWVSK